MAGIFDEENMRAVLGQYLPQGETLEAGVHCVGLNVRFRQLFRGAAVIDGAVVPRENGPTIMLTKGKYARFDAYLGLSQSYLLFATCEQEPWGYKVEKSDGAGLTPLDRTIPLTEIAACIPLAHVSGFEQKKGIVGSVNCRITLQNGEMKLMIPKRGGLGNGMPHYAEYRETILARLTQAAKS